MIRKILKFFFYPLYKFIYHPSFRYSVYFRAFQNLSQYSAKEQMLDLSMRFLKFSEMCGDYLEFGVYKGDSFISAFHLAQLINLCSMRFYAFDSFKGLPKPKGVDTGWCYECRQYKCDINSFRKNIKKNKVDLDKVKIVSGWYNKTLNDKTKKELPIKKASIVMVDCDLYESTVSVLDFVTSYVQEGTIIIFDDWFCFKANPDKGEQKAFKEWLEKNPSIKVVEFRRFGWHGNSFIVTKSEV